MELAYGRERSPVLFGLVVQTAFSAGARLVCFVQTPLPCQPHNAGSGRVATHSPMAATEMPPCQMGGHEYLEEIRMRITIPLVVLVAILVGPSAFAQSPSQDNA